MRRCVVVGAMLGVLCLSGCGPDASEGVEVIATPRDDDSAANDTAARSARAGKIYQRPDVATVEPALDDSFVMINGGTGIINPDFNEYTDLTPTYWYIENGPVRIQESAGPEMTPAIRLGPGYYYTWVSQDLVFDESPAGKTLTLTAMARCPEAEKARIMIQVTEKQKEYSDHHPGDDQWHELSVTTRVPADFEGNTIGIFLTHKGQPEEACWYDDVNIRVN